MNLPGPLPAFPVGQRPALADGGVRGAWHWRPLTAEDLPWLAALYASTREDEMRGLPWPAVTVQQFLDQQFRAQHLHYLAHYPQAHYLAITHEGGPVGRLYLDEAGADDRIVDISLLPACRGQGTGTAVLVQVLAAAARRGRGVTLNVLAGNIGARRLYERLGFVPQGDQTGPLHLPMRWCARHTPAHITAAIS